MKIVKRFCILLTVLFMFTLTGCWNYREIESLNIVSGVAIDQGENGYKYHLTIQYVNLSGGSSSKSSPKPVLVDSDGNTIFDAVRNLILQSQKKFYFSDCKIAIISHQLADEGIVPLLDWFTKDQEPRITIDLLVSREEKASDILKQKEGSDEISAFSINQMIENSPKYIGKSPDVAIYQADNLIYGQGISLVLPAIKMEQTGDEKKPEMAGTAVFKGDKLLGFLDDTDSQFMLFVQNKLKGGILLTNVVTQEDRVSLEIEKSKTSISHEMTDGQPLMKIKIKVDAVLAEENYDDNVVSQFGLEEVQKCAAKAIEEGVSGIINKVQTQYDSDIFGFGKNIYQKNPRYWKTVSSDWDSIFPDLNCQITADVKILNTAIANPKEYKS